MLLLLLLVIYVRSTLLRLHTIVTLEFVPLRSEGLSKVIVNGRWRHHDVSVGWRGGTIGGGLILKGRGFDRGRRLIDCSTVEDCCHVGRLEGCHGDGW